MFDNRSESFNTDFEDGSVRGQLFFFVSSAAQLCALDQVYESILRGELREVMNI